MQPAMTAATRRILLAMAVLAAAGAVVSSVSLYHHYGTSQTSFCDFAENFNCDIVNRSRYAMVFGIPVALIGICGYVVLLVLATRYRSQARTPAVLLSAATLGLGFAFYLTYVEAFVLGAWCILCLSSLALILLITFLSSILVAQSMRKP
jgi:vitamin-K-epoxide reductase (warfarin-sensitive)